MTSETPQFDKALDTILTPLTPHERNCPQCDAAFRVMQEDIDMYHMLRVPPPTLCPLCRKKRRFGHLMRVPKFFKKECSVQGHDEKIVSVYPPDAQHKVYDFSYWHSDKWGAAEFGREYDTSKGFFEQFKELHLVVPHVPLERDPHGVNTEYTLGGAHGKNNYYTAMGYKSEDCMYSVDVRYCKNLVDCTLDGRTEFCYETVVSWGCNRCLFVVASSSCIDSAFLYDCRNCSSCFMSSNVRNKKYVFENKQLTKEEYSERMKKIDLGDRAVVDDYKRKFDELYQSALHRSVLTGRDSKNSVGDSFGGCKDCYFVFRTTGGAENVRYGDNIENVEDSMDVLNAAADERVYEIIAVVHGTHNRFSMYLRNSTYVEYSSECYDCHYCFGCVGLKNKKFHIFNRPYSENEYWETVDRIKTKMLEDGEYGEFFDLKFGLVPYQSSSGQYFFQLERKEAEKLGIPWYDEPASDIPEGIRMRKAPDKVQARIDDVTDDILKDTIICEVSGKPFRITKRELDFYRAMHLPLPTKHPWQRMMERKRFEHRIELFPFTCPECKEKSFSVYTPEEQEKMNIVCEPCYLKKVS